MDISEMFVAAAVFLVLFAAIGLLSSRNLTEYLVSHGLLPRSALQLAPVLVAGARWIAVILIVLGVGRAAVVAGLLSGEWIRRYGLALVMVAAGVTLLWLSYRERRS